MPAGLAPNISQKQRRGGWECGVPARAPGRVRPRERPGAPPVGCSEGARRGRGGSPVPGPCSRAHTAPSLVPPTTCPPASAGGGGERSGRGPALASTVAGTPRDAFVAVNNGPTGLLGMSPWGPRGRHADPAAGGCPALCPPGDPGNRFPSTSVQVSPPHGPARRLCAPGLAAFSPASRVDSSVQAPPCSTLALPRPASPRPDRLPPAPPAPVCPGTALPACGQSRVCVSTAGRGSAAGTGTVQS